MRITGGNLRGRKLLETKRDGDLRPTTDRNREALFNILNSGKFLQEIEFELNGAKVLDLCCGTGAVSFEALSRGAKQAFLLDKEQNHLKLAKENAEKLKIIDQCQFSLYDAQKPILFKEKFDLIFIDPPYKFKIDKIIRRVLESEICHKNTLIAVESDKEQNFDDLTHLDSRKYGITHFDFFVIK